MKKPILLISVVWDLHADSTWSLSYWPLRSTKSLARSTWCCFARVGRATHNNNLCLISDILYELFIRAGPFSIHHHMTLYINSECSSLHSIILTQSKTQTLFFLFSLLLSVIPSIVWVLENSIDILYNLNKLTTIEDVAYIGQTS